MAGSSEVFEARIQQRLVVEQRRAVLEALRDDIDDGHTVGEVFDAAAALGWAEPLGDLSLADLAGALLGDATEAASDRAAVATEDDEDDEVEDDAVPAKGRKVARVAKATAKKAGKKTAAKKTSGKKTAAAKKTTGKKSAATGKKTAAKKTAAKKAPEVEVDDRMSLDEAVAYFVPLVESLGEATMQDLEDETGVGRRKLRFHVGQLVRHGYLERHGMGRGTHYTVA